MKISSLFFVLALTLGGVAEAIGQIDKSIPITVTTNTGRIDQLVVRICGLATDIVDPTDPCDAILPPVPPSSAYDVRLRNTSNVSGFDASTDARKPPTTPNAVLDYDIIYQVGSVSDIPITSMTFSWDAADIAAIPEINSLTLQDNVTGALVGPIDMTSQTQFVIDDASPFWDTVDLRVRMTMVLPPLDLDIKFFLSGAYAGGSMRTSLNTSGILETQALNHPYSGSPWNYAGTESVPANFFDQHPDIVDWVLLKLYSGDLRNPPLYLASETVAFLKSDGSVMDVGGNNFASFTAMSGFYYLVAYHRNHLPVFGGKVIDLRSGSAVYDMSDSMSKVFSSVGNPMKQLAPGVFGLWGGDGDANNSVTAFDFVAQFLPINGGSEGYYSGDFNMDGDGTAFDFVLVWLEANGKSAQFP